MATKSNSVNNSLNTRKGAEEFRKAAKAYGARSTRTKASANSALVKVGTHTPTGKLSKHYK
jgi:hypothetical protein